MAVVGVYASLFGLYKIKSALSAKPPVPVVEAVAAAPVVSGGAASKWGFEPPTLETFDAWGANEENFVDGLMEMATSGQTQADKLLDAYVNKWGMDIDRVYKELSF